MGKYFRGIWSDLRWPYENCWNIYSVALQGREQFKNGGRWRLKSVSKFKHRSIYYMTFILVLKAEIYFLILVLEWYNWSFYQFKWGSIQILKNDNFSRLYIKKLGQQELAHVYQLTLELWNSLYWRLGLSSVWEQPATSKSSLLKSCQIWQFCD